MGIFSRFTDIINANINALLDKAEDPQKMIRMIIQEMEDTLVEVRTLSARSLADKKELNRKISGIERQVADWQAKATLALTKSREDLARAALIEKKKLTSTLDKLNEEFALVEETIAKFTKEISELEAKLVETRARQQALVMRREVAEKRHDVQKKFDTSKTDKAMAKFEQYERKIDELEAQADSYSLGKARHIEAEFMELQAQDDIEIELAKMKESLQK